MLCSCLKFLGELEPLHERDITVEGRRPWWRARWFVLCVVIEDAGASCPRLGLRTQQTRRHLRVGRGLVRRNTYQSRRKRSDQRGRDPQPFRLLGRHCTPSPGPTASLNRARLLRYWPETSAADPASQSSRARRRPPLRDQHRIDRSGHGRLRRRGCWRRSQLTHSSPLRVNVHTQHRHAAVPVRLAGHPSEVRRRVYIHLRRDQTRVDVGPRVSIRRRPGHVHRRVFTTDLRQLWFR